MSEAFSHSELDKYPLTGPLAEIQKEVPPQATVKLQAVASVKHRVTKHPGYKRLYSIAEAAHYLGRSTWSVRRLIWDGELPCVRGGRRVHLDVRDMEEFIEQHKERC